MCSLVENRALLYSIVGSFALIVIFVTGIMPEFSQQFSIVEFPSEVNVLSDFEYSMNILTEIYLFFLRHQFRLTILSVLAADLVCSLVIDRICEFVLGESKMKSI